MPLIVIEGIDGSGKTTQIDLLKKHYSDSAHPPLFLREPGGTRLGEQLRSLILDPATECSPQVEMLIYMAARIQLLQERIKPALDQGRTVILDRYYYSTVAYQIHGLDFKPQKPYIHFAERMPYWAVNEIPDRTIFLEISIEEARKRISAKNKDRIESRSEQYFERVQEGYDIALRHAQDNGHNIVRVNATQFPEIIHKYILGVIGNVESH